MKQYPAEYDAHVKGDATTLALCWMIEKRNEDIIRGTTLDDDIEIEIDTDTSFQLNGVYFAAAGIKASETRGKSDLSVDNTQVEGGLEGGAAVLDISVADIESGDLDNAAVTFFLVNYLDPSSYLDIRQRGYLGEISRTQEGVYRAEIRSLTQRMAQIVGATYGDTCDVVRFGDARCGLDLSSLIVTGTVDAVISRRRFDATLSDMSQDAGYFETGEILFTSGANANRLKQVKFDSVGDVMGHLSLWDEFYNDIEVGDTFSLKPGCRRTYEACEAWNNVINFRGHGLLIPGVPNIIRAP